MNHHTATTWLRLVIASLLAAAMGVVFSASAPAGAVDLGPAGGFTNARTSMELEDDPLAEGNKVVDGVYGPTSFDWNSILPEFGGAGRGPYTTTAAPGITSKQSLGVVDTSFGYDVADSTASFASQQLAACTGNDPSGLPGSQTISSYPLTIAPENNINNKGDLCSGGAAIEVLEENGQYRYVLYQYWTRQPITGGNSGEFNIFQILEGPQPGRCDDLAIWFDYSSSSQVVENISVLEWTGPNCLAGGGDAWTASSLDVNAYAGNTGKNPDLDPARAPQPSDNFGSFGESAVDLTSAGVIPTDECATFTLAGFVSSTSNNGNPNGQQLLDVFTYPEPIVIDTCADVRIDKETKPLEPNPAADFDYLIDASNPANPNSYTGTLTVPGNASELRTDVVASPAYALTETGLESVWSNTLVSCQALDPITLTWQLYSYLPGSESAVPFPVAPSTALDGAGAPLPPSATVPVVNPGETAACKLVNEASGIIVEKAGDGDDTVPFPFTVGAENTSLTIGDSQFFALEAGSNVTITEGMPNPPVSPGFVLDDITCLDAAGGEVGTPSGDAGVTVTVGQPDNVITCTFTNIQNGRIIVDKDGLPADSDQTFDFTITGPEGSTSPINVPVNDLTIPGPAGAPVTVQPGVYTVTELEPPTDADWVLVDIVCDNEVADSQDLTAQSVQVAVDSGETVNCTFTNNERGPVTVTKTAELLTPAPNVGTIDQFDVRYTVTATSSSFVTEQITVVDAYDFPATITPVGTPAVTGPGQPSAWNGVDQTTLYTGSIAAGAELVWTIETTVELDLDAPTGDRVCDGDPGSGAFNGVTLTVTNGGTASDDACVSFGDPTIAVDKTVVGDVTVNADATMSVTYQIDVTNTGTGPGSYEVTDAFGFPTWVTVTDVDVTGPAGVLVDPAFDGDADQAITTGPVGIGAGETDVYSITVTFTAVPTATDDGVACATGPGDGLFNLASITSTSGPDEDPACIDIPRGRIVVTKATLGGTGTFSFTGVALFPGNAITTTTADGTPSAPISAWVTPGTYGLTESAPAGWTKITEPCTSFLVADGQTVDCDYENGKQGSITVQKIADPDGTFEFTFGPSDDVQLVDSGTAGYTWSGLDAGDYSLTESADTAWQLLGATCGTAPYTNGGTISLPWGEDVTCVFSNEALSEIVVEKTTDPVTDPTVVAFDFTGDIGDFSIGHGESDSSGAIVAGTYDVSELVPAGWDLTDITCSVESLVGQPTGSTWTYGGDATFADGDTSAEIELSPGDKVSCEFTNTERGEIVVTKEIADGTAIGAALLQTFDFDLGGDFATDEQFTLDGNGDDTDGTVSSETFEVRPGAYTVGETVPDDWNLDGVVCTDDQDPADLTVAPGETVECTFTNSPDPADVTIRKSVVNVASDYQWSFDFTIAPDPDGDGGQDATKPAAGTGPTAVSIGWTGLIPGQQYTISEAVPTNWTQSGLVCVGLADLDQDTTDASVTFVAEPGQTLSCSVTNTPEDPTITIVKTTVGGTGSFDFEVTPENDEDTLIEETIVTEDDGVAEQGTTYPILTGLTYAVDELDPGAEWAEGALDCGAFGTAAPGAAVDVTGEPGDDIVCEITNSALGNITVIKSTVGADGTFGFSINDDPFEITTTTGSGQEDFQNLQPGEYVITETDPTADFDGTKLACVSSNDDIETVDLSTLTATVDLSNGETVVCTFTNTERAHIVVDKKTNPSGDDTLFTFAEDWTPLTGGSFQIADGDTPHDSGPIPSNTTYTLVEAPTTNWVVTGFECTGGVNEVVYDVDTNDADGASAEITPAPGETILCTVTNNLRGPVTITKVADAAGVTRVGDVYTVSYDLTVGTGSYITEDFTLTDTPAFASGTTILTTTVTDESSAEVTLPLDGSIEPGETLSYTVTIEFTIDGALPLADRDCAGTGTATFNSATVTYDVDPGTSSDDDCVDLPDPDISVTKTAVTDPTQPVHQGGNEYTVGYDIVVTNDGEGPGSYTLVEAPDFGAGIDVTAISATSADGTVDPAFALGSLTLADGVDLQADESHTYTVTVTFTIAADSTLEARDCSGPGTATYNSVSLTYNGVEGDPADDCVDLPDPEITIDKVVSDGQPVHVGDNVYAAEYTITVDNVGDGPGAYDLVDTPDFGTGATVTNVTVTGNGVSIDQDGDAAVTIITGEAIDPDEAAHVYTVTVTFEVAGSMTTEARTCVTGEGRAGFGAYNGAEVTYQGGSVEDDDCVDIPEPDVSIIKSLDAANPLTRNADGTWAIGYLLTVSNATDAGPADYDLTDTFDFPAGVTVDDVTVQIVGTDPASSVLVAGFDGDGQPVVASDVRIDDGESHVYRILVDLSIEVVRGIDGACSNEGGLENTMSVSVRGDEPLTDDACDSFSTLTLVKRVVNDGGGTAVPADFTLTANGPAKISGAGTVKAAVPAGTYQLNETQVDGYELTSLTCDNASGQVGSAVVADGANVTCTFVNDDDPVADLAIVKSASVTTVGPDGAFDWTLVVTNNGPGTALDVEVNDLVPSSLTVGNVTSSFFDCTRSGNAVSCTRPSMAVGASGTITIAVTVNGTAVDGPITNVGTVESSTPDPDLTNNSDDATVDVVIPLPPTTLPPVILPPTGSDSTSPLVRSALALVLLGGVVLLITRRRRGDGTVTPS